MAKYTTSKPSWVPEEPNEKFACSVMGGIEGIKDTTVGNINPRLKDGTFKPKKRLALSEDDEFIHKKYKHEGDETHNIFAYTVTKRNS